MIASEDEKIIREFSKRIDKNLLLKKIDECYDCIKTKKDKLTEKDFNKNLTEWFDKNYTKTTNNKDFIKLHEVFNEFRSSEYYFNMSKINKRQYNYRYFIKQIEENIFFAKYYEARKCIDDVEYRNILTYHKKIIFIENTKQLIFNGGKCDKYGYVYLLIEREFIKTHENIYKIGVTRNISKRVNQYPKCSKLELSIHVKMAVECETLLKHIFDEKFKNRKDIGREYYEGDIYEMISVMNDICKKYIMKS